MSLSLCRFPAAVLTAILLLTSSASYAESSSTVQKIRERGALLWGSDSEGGAPYVFPDPKDPSKLIGFELDIAEAVARKLGVRSQLVPTVAPPLPDRCTVAANSGVTPTMSPRRR